MREKEKITANWTIPVSHEFREKVQIAKNQGVDINRWARDLVREHWHEIETLLSQTQATGT